MEGPALIIKTTFTGRISAASVGGCAFQGHVRDNHEEGKVCRGFKKNKNTPSQLGLSQLGISGNEIVRKIITIDDYIVCYF